MNSQLLGTVRQLWRYPVKSMGGEMLASLAVADDGVVGDRYFALKDRDGRLGSGKSTKRFRQIDGLLDFSAATAADGVIVRFPDGRSMHADDPTLAPALSAACGIDVAVESEVEGERKHRDDAPIHILSEASLAWLRARLPETAIDVRRFRPNLVIVTAADGLPEQDWIGRELAIGDALVVRIAAPTGRCVMTTLPQAELPPAPAVLHTINREAATALGVYAEVLRAGAVRVGDVLRFA